MTSRRQFLRLAAATTSALLHGCATTPPQPPARLFFTSRGRTGIVHADGSGLRYLDLQRPDQVTWQPGPALSNGREVVFLSMEARRDGPGRPFDKFYHKTPCHLWLYDLDRDRLTEIATRNRIAPFQTPALLVSDSRILVQVVRDEGGQIFSMNLDGTDAREFTRLGEGLPYGLALSPERQRIAYHLASPKGYQVWTCDPDGSRRTLVAADPARLFFGPTWSPDGQWLAFQGCDHAADPGHDWSDVYVAHPDGTGLRALTRGQSMWFAATYGNPAHRGGGSNVVAWTRDGRIVFPRRTPGARVPWRYQAQRPDTDHFNREFEPEQASGGVHLSLIDPVSGASTALTAPANGVWDFRGTPSADGRHVAYCRALTGGVPELRVLSTASGDSRVLTRGVDDSGADHPRWVS